MNETYNTTAIILKRQVFRECDSRVVVYGDKIGKIDLIARGTKKTESKLAGHLEPISLSSLMVVRGRRFDYIGSAFNKNAFINIKNDLDKINIASEAIKIFHKLVKEGEKDEKIFVLLVEFLEELNSEVDKADLQLFFDFFIFKFISDLGHTPELYNCVVCKNKIKPNNNKFDLPRGGIVCPDCRKKENNLLAATNESIKVLRFILKNDFKSLTKLSINDNLSAEINMLISSFYNYNFEQ